MRSIVVRDMIPSDIQEVLAVETSSFTSPWTENAVRSEPGSFGSIARVAVCDGNIAGFLFARRVFEEAELLQVAVSPLFRRRGLARLLMEDLIDLLKAAPAKKVFLEVRISNTAAVSLYRRFGFEETGIRRDYYRSPVEDAVLMELQMK
jgi:ribosomal-protein-alanine N-acetyltransferase